MQLFDTHSHFSADDIAPVQRAQEAGLAGVIAVGGNQELNIGAKTAAAHFPRFAHLALGWDRTMTKLPPGIAAERLLEEYHHYKLTETPLCAIGEIGLDYFHDKGTVSKQKTLFRRQVALAAALALPVIVHCRDAEADVLAILKDAGSPALRADGRLGVIHCFTGSAEFAEAALALGLMVSFSGIVTFRNADALRAVAKGIPADRLLVETDCPYLTPVPLRGVPNEPAFVTHVAKCLATQRGETLEALAEATTANAGRMFGRGE